MKGKYYDIEEAYKLKDKYIYIKFQFRDEKLINQEKDLKDSIQNLYGEPTIYED